MADTRLSALQISSHVMERQRTSGAPQIVPPQGLSDDRERQPPGCPSLYVRDLRPTRTACGWGLSLAEVRRLSGTIHFLRRILRRTGLPCWYAVLGDGVLEMAEVDARELFRDAASYIVQAQGRAGHPQYWLRVLESSGGLHANLIFPASPVLADRFRRSIFGQYCSGAGLQEIGRSDKDWQALQSYLAKERTPQAEYALGHRLGPRLRGSHQLGDGGGDRVQLSRALRQDALVAGAIVPWQRTKARALPRPERIVQISPRPDKVDTIKITHTTATGWL
jgi:hypothetical protein